MKKTLISLGAAILLAAIFITGCHKELINTPANYPDKFTDLVTSPEFDFENFRDVIVDISLEEPASGGVEVIRIYQDSPLNGRLITTGVVKSGSGYLTTVRVPKALTELYLQHIGSDGSVSNGVAPINGNQLTFRFTSTKSVAGEMNVCGYGTAITTNQTNVTVNTGETYYVPVGSVVSISGTLTVASGGTFNNCGTLTVNAVSVPATNGVINNNGTFTITSGVDYKGALNNFGILNLTGNNEFKLNSGSVLNNYCTFDVTGKVKITGSGALHNYSYIRVAGNDGSFNAGGGSMSLGSGSLIEAKYFDLQIICAGPSTPGYAGITTIGGKTTGGASVTGYVDLCATGSIQPDNGSYGPNVLGWNLVQTVPVPVCGVAVPPLITSPLTASGTVGVPITPYIITATGTEVITYNATNLPAGLAFDPGTHTITGTVSASGVYNITLTAENQVGTDTKILVLTITSGGGYVSWYPNAVDFGTFVYEDLWPGFGDYDCNDMSVNFQYQIISNSDNKVTDFIATFKFKAAGAELNNGFGFVLSTPHSEVSSVTGSTILGSSVTLDPKGYEAAGSGDETVIVVVDAVNTMFGRGMVNTMLGGYTVAPFTKVITVHFSEPQAFIGELPLNPFIFVNQERGKEIHLKDQPPTSMVNSEYFGIWADRSEPGIGKYYRSETGLPWAFEVPVDFSHPVEKVDILQTYTKFAAWAESEGVLFPDWYEDKPGYRVPANIWHP